MTKICPFHAGISFILLKVIQWGQTFPQFKLGMSYTLPMCMNFMLKTFFQLFKIRRRIRATFTQNILTLRHFNPFSGNFRQILLRIYRSFTFFW